MATISGILNNLRKANQRIEKNTADLTAEIERASTAEQNLADDYVPKAGNETPLTESAEWQITGTGALQRTATKRNITTGETSTVTQTPIPVVENQARLILPEEIEKIRDLAQWQEINNGNALNYSVDLSDIPNGGNANETAVQTYLTQKFNAAGNTTGNPTMDLITLIDDNTGAKYVWYVNESAWVQSNSATGAQASNDMYDQNDNLTQLGTKGVIKGSNKKGKGFVEVDGTLSVVGFDVLEQKTDNNTSALGTEKTNRENADSALNTKIGNTDTLTTDDKTSTVSAINEIDAHADSAQTTANTAMANAATAQSTADSKYALPSGGIPKTDLTSAVQTSLSNGDAALAGLATKQDNLSATQLANIAAVPNKADKTDIVTETGKLSKIYGVDGVGQSNPTLTRTDSATNLTVRVGRNTVKSDFDECYPWCDMKRVTDDKGNVFVQIPKFYAKRTSNGNGTEKWQISGTQHSGFTTLFVDGNGNEIDYVCVGAYEGSGSSSQIFSKSGQSVLVNITMDNFRAGCRANGSGYQQYDFLIDWILKYLFTIEFATTNTQSIMYGFANGNSAKVNTGQTDLVAAEIGSTRNNTDGKSACKYRGIENPWGNTWTFVDGISFSGANVYLCKDPASYSAGSTSSPYQYVGTRATTGEGYIKSINSFDNNPLLGYISSASGASDSTHFCDYCWYNSGGQILLVGGYWPNGSWAGLWYWNGYYAASSSNSNFGGRLCYKPL